MRIAIYVQDEQVTAMLKALQRRMGNLSPVMKTIGETVRTSVIRNFEKGGRPDKWEPTKHISKQIAYRMGAGRMEGDEEIGKLKYRKGKKTHKAYKGGEIETKGFQRYAAGHKTLIDTGRLRKSIAARAFSNRAEVGTNVIYAAIHQRGGKAGRGRKVNIPARPYLMVQNEDWKIIREHIMKYLAVGWR